MELDSSMGAWCLMSPSLECVTHGGIWVVFQTGLKLLIGCANSGASQEVQTKVSHSLSPAWVHSI